MTKPRWPGAGAAGRPDTVTAGVRTLENVPRPVDPSTSAFRVESPSLYQIVFMPRSKFQVLLAAVARVAKLKSCVPPALKPSAASTPSVAGATLSDRPWMAPVEASRRIVRVVLSSLNPDRAANC